MATIAIQRPSLAGATFTYATPTQPDQFANSGSELVHIKNAGASSITVTFDSPNTCSFESTALPNHDLVVTIAAGAEKVVGPLSPARFNDANGFVQVTYSTVVDTRILVLGR